MNLQDGSFVPLSVSRARSIVSRAESDFASGCRIDDAFVPFSAAGASTRSEARAAVLLTIADYFKQAKEQGAMDDFDDYARASRFIATRIMCDDMRDEAQLHQAALSYGREFESFVAYLRTQTPTTSSYWPGVYERIGQPYPSAVTHSKQAQSHGKPWWRFW